MLRGRVGPWLTALFALVVVTVFNATAFAQRCPPGYRLDRWRRCVPFAVRPVVCPPGYVLDRFGRCAPAVVPARACPPGYFYFRGRCVHR